MPSSVVPFAAAYTLEDVLGSRGPPAQRFLQPTACTSLAPTVGSADVIVAEAHKLTRLSPTGQLRRTISAPLDTQGGRGASSRPLRFPAGLVSHEHDLIVADTYNHRLLRMHLSDGRPLTNATHGRVHFGAPLTNLRFPRGLATITHEWPPHGPLPMLYVADSGNNRVCAFALASSLPSLGATPTLSLPGPVSTAKDAAMVPLMCFGTAAGAPAAEQMGTPSAVAVARMAGLGESAIRLFVADTHHDRVMEWAYVRSTTTYRHQRNVLGSAGVGALHRPVGVALVLARRPDREKSRLIVTEREGGRAHVFTASGSFLQILTPPEAGALGGVCLARRPNVDQAYDAHRVLLVGRERHSLYVYRRRALPPPRYEHPPRG